MASTMTSARRDFESAVIDVGAGPAWIRWQGRIWAVPSDRCGAVALCAGAQICAPLCRDSTAQWPHEPTVPPPASATANPSWLRIQLHAETVRGAEHRTGEVLGNTAARHTSAQFVAFRGRDQQPSQVTGSPGRLDKVSNKTAVVGLFPAEHLNVTMYCTPTYSSCLNQVQNWFARIQRDVITRDIFTGAQEVDKKLTRNIRHYNETAAPLKWKHAEPRRHIRCDSSGSQK